MCQDSQREWHRRRPPPSTKKLLKMLAAGKSRKIMARTPSSLETRLQFLGQLENAASEVVQLSGWRKLGEVKIRSYLEGLVDCRRCRPFSCSFTFSSSSFYPSSRISWFCLVDDNTSLAISGFRVILSFLEACGIELDEQLLRYLLFNNLLRSNERSVSAVI